MRASCYVLALAITAVALGGCGQKGPLYRDAPAREEAGSIQQDSARDGESEDGKDS
ncbi:lipoprotein [Marinobacter sp.]|uniref:LPS translocon maturation chaperone LptM n=1 Tax=Marinobacter sp. TaxID=50741 RepID=UPI00384AB535